MAALELKVSKDGPSSAFISEAELSTMPALFRHREIEMTNLCFPSSRIPTGSMQDRDGGRIDGSHSAEVPIDGDDSLRPTGYDCDQPKSGYFLLFIDAFYR